MKYLILGLIIATALPAASMASGSSVRGGGDPCEDRIKSIRDDLNSWIRKGGANDLKLPGAVSVSSYEESMSLAMKSASIQCVGPGDREYPVAINGTAKVCRFDKDSSASRITCDTAKFERLTESDQYMLIHHEFAGLAGIEKPIGNDSIYTVSNQISGYLVDQIVKRLAVKPTLAAIGIPTNFKPLDKSESSDVTSSFYEELRKNFKTIKCSTDKNSQFDVNELSKLKDSPYHLYLYISENVRSAEQVFKTPDSRYFQFQDSDAFDRLKINVIFKMNDAGTEILGIKLHVLKIEPEQMYNAGTIAKPVYKFRPTRTIDLGTNSCTL